MKKTLVFLMVAVMLTIGTLAAFEKVNTYNNNFTDVKDTNWYAENVKTAYELGLMNGKTETTFDPNGNVTVVEGITLAARLHALYNNTEVKKTEKVVAEYRFDFDDPSIIVDLSERNSRNNGGINFNRATGYIEDGVLVVQPDAPNQNGSYDPQIKFVGLELPAKDYNKVTFRMKRDVLPNVNDGARSDSTEFFFETNVNPGISAERQINIRYKTMAENLEDWFEIEFDVGEHENWSDVISGFRFDPSNDNGIYYIDYIVLSKSEKIENSNWYDIYVDYAVENDIIKLSTYKTSDYTRNITRYELCNLILAAVPVDSYGVINNVKGIPDIPRDAKNADAYLALYNAGILLGSDAAGTFNGNSDIKRSEVAAIINRVALPENRVKGEITFDWASQGNEYDLEFNDPDDLNSITYEADAIEIKDGALVLTAPDRGEERKPRFDPKIGVENISLDASDYTKLKVRMKADFIGEYDDVSIKGDFYFMTDGDEALSEAKSLHADFTSSGYTDAAGWYIVEVDFSSHEEWKGTITGYRFDPANTNGIFTIDYIRLVPSDPFFNASHEALLAEGYTATGMLQDNAFARGFEVQHFEQKKLTEEERVARYWQYTDGAEAPTWKIGPWWCQYDLWENRDTSTDKYTLTDDKGINTLVYNPAEKSLSMRVNATKIYNGEPHGEDYKWWPHLLLDQPYTTYAVDKVKNSAAADRIFVELDMRIVDYKDTTNTEGRNSCQFPLYFYLLTDKSPNEKIWFGLSLMNGTDSNGTRVPGWAPDSAAHQYMYGIKQADVFGDMANSFNPEPGKLVTGEWKHIRVDITEHIERCLEWANRDNAFGYGVEVTKEDMYFGGCNIGFEIHGNYDCTIEIKNLDMIAYNK